MRDERGRLNAEGCCKFRNILQTVIDIDKRISLFWMSARHETTCSTKRCIEVHYRLYSIVPFYPNCNLRRTNTLCKSKQLPNGEFQKSECLTCITITKMQFVYLDIDLEGFYLTCTNNKQKTRRRVKSCCIRPIPPYRPSYCGRKWFAKAGISIVPLLFAERWIASITAL